MTALWIISTALLENRYIFLRENNLESKQVEENLRTGCKIDREDTSYVLDETRSRELDIITTVHWKTFNQFFLLPLYLYVE